MGLSKRLRKKWRRWTLADLVVTLAAVTFVVQYVTYTWTADEQTYQRAVLNGLILLLLRAYRRA